MRRNQIGYELEEERKSALPKGRLLYLIPQKLWSPSMSRLVSDGSPQLS